MIVCRNLVKRYGEHVAVDDLSFGVPAGQICAFLGQNGAGKSTTVKMITGHHQHTATEIAAELGFTGNTLTGAELDRMDANQLATAIDAISAFARGTPFNKVKIARAAKQRPRGGNDG